MFTLGIETSCDETSAAVVKNGNTVLSNIVSSSLPLHKEFGGVIPEIASRAHLEVIIKVTQNAIKKAKIKLRNINLISVTSNPGLPGALLVGISFARALSVALKTPILELNHLEAHIYANFLNKTKPVFPFIGFVISGGHTHIFLIKNVRDWKLIGSTRDDAAGEAFDKVAKILGLGFPGGPIIEKKAGKGSPNKVKLTCAQLGNSLDFSFSGIKTAVLYYIQSLKKLKISLTAEETKDIAASFQKSIVDILIEKAIRACKKYQIKNLVMGGGVSCNNFLRKNLIKEAKTHKIKVFFPEKEFCLDNAAMVAALGYQMFKNRGE